MPKRQGRYKPKVMAVDPARLRAVEDVLQPHLQERVPRRDRLIEYLHILQDKQVIYPFRSGRISGINASADG